MFNLIVFMLVTIAAFSLLPQVLEKDYGYCVAFGFLLSLAIVNLVFGICRIFKEN